MRVPNKPKVLIADDEPVIADTLAMILNQSGFEAKAVYSGEQAVELASDFAPDMLVSDVIMKDLNGMETAIVLRSMLPRLKVLLFSGQAASADLLAQAQTRGYEFELLAKPVHPKDLLNKLRTHSAQDIAALPAVPTANQSESWQAAPTGLVADSVSGPADEN